MQRGARRAAVEGGGDAKRPGNRPFGTEESLEVSTAPPLTRVPGTGAPVNVTCCQVEAGSNAYRNQETRNEVLLGWCRS